jgi:purine-nucleoside/S-methyl-5'-thioadenosine phosphorylase / adenosine deaminase
MTEPMRAATIPAADAVPGLVHGFEQRLGPTGWESREETRRRVAAALSGRGRLLLLRQVHGAAVRDAPWEGLPEGDASVAREPGWILGIETADCLPVLLVDPRRRRVAAAHAGWRGTAKGVARAAVRALVATGCAAADVLALLGPGIGVCCYEVGEEVGAAFAHPGSRFLRPGPRGKPHLDVRAANQAQLLDEGVPPGSIHHLADCTACRPDLYHSYRRDRTHAGRMISFVGFERAG